MKDRIAEEINDGACIIVTDSEIAYYTILLHCMEQNRGLHIWVDLGPHLFGCERIRRVELDENYRLQSDELTAHFSTLSMLRREIIELRRRRTYEKTDSTQ